MKKKEKKKQGFAITGVLYSILLLFVVMLIGILNNLEGRKQLLDVMKEDTIKASESDEAIKDLYEQVSQLKKQLIDTNTELLKIKTEAQTHVSYTKTHNFSENEEIILNKTVPFDVLGYASAAIRLDATDYPAIGFHIPGISGGALAMGKDKQLYWQVGLDRYRINMTFIPVEDRID